MTKSVGHIARMEGGTTCCGGHARNVKWGVDEAREQRQRGPRRTQGKGVSYMLSLAILGFRGAVPSNICMSA